MFHHPMCLREVEPQISEGLMEVRILEENHGDLWGSNFSTYDPICIHTVYIYIYYNINYILYVYIYIL